jgi:hypothetical protein
VMLLAWTTALPLTTGAPQAEATSGCSQSVCPVAGSNALSPLEATYSAFGAAGAGVDVEDGVEVAAGDPLVLPQAASAPSSATARIAIAMVRVERRELVITSFLTFSARSRRVGLAPKQTPLLLETGKHRQVQRVLGVCARPCDQIAIIERDLRSGKSGIAEHRLGGGRIGPLREMGGPLEVEGVR